MKTRQKLYLSPSENHQHLMDQIQPSLSYRGGNVSSWQRKLRAKLHQLVGDRPAFSEDLNVRSLWKRDLPDRSIEKIVFQSEPYSDVPAFVCIPQKLRPPYPFAICLQGHSTGMHLSIGVDFKNNFKKQKIEGDRDFALNGMINGWATLCIEQRAFGERSERKQSQIAPHGCHDAAMQALMLGRTLMGERVLDVDRGIDYLAQRGDVDMNQVGIMGQSGGGTVSMFSAALLPRIQWAMPACNFCTFRDSIMSIYHCADNYIPELFKYADMSDIMGLFAPKPVVIVSGLTDPIFPIAGTRRAFKNLQTIYAGANALKKCRLVVGNGGHRFYADQAWSTLHRIVNSKRT